MKLVTHFAALVSAVLLITIGSAWALPAAEQLEKFDSMLAKHPEEIWASSIDAKLKSAIHDYTQKTKLENGRNYGESVRAFSLKDKCPSEIESEMLKRDCVKQVDVIREPKENKPILVSGKASPIWQFVCPDGGVLKIKPEGDPSNKFVPYPHGSRTLRFPADSVYRDYRDEVAKVSENGHIIPRSPSDLAPKDLVDGWSKAAHSALAPPEKCNVR